MQQADSRFAEFSRAVILRESNPPVCREYVVALLLILFRLLISFTRVRPKSVSEKSFYLYYLLCVLDVKRNPIIIPTKLRTLLLQSKSDIENLKLFCTFLEKTAKENNIQIDKDILVLYVSPFFSN